MAQEAEVMSNPEKPIPRLFHPMNNDGAAFRLMWENKLLECPHFTQKMRDMMDDGAPMSDVRMAIVYECRERFTP